jgi:hypothetical protein
LTLLITSAVLISSATSTFIRIEAKNQAFTSLPQLDAAAEYRGSEGEISLKISASKLRDTEWIYLTIYGVRRGIRYESPHPCVDEPKKCEFIADADVNPDPVGAVVKNIKIPFSPLTYQHLEIAAIACESRQKGSDCNLEHAEKTTAVDFEITRP